MRPGGVRAVVAESVLLKHQLVISRRARRRAPNLNSFDRFIFGLGSLLVPASRLPKLAVMLKPRTLLRFHEALKRRIIDAFSRRVAIGAPAPKGHRSNSSTRSSNSNAVIPVSAIPASPKRSRVPLASTSTKTWLAAFWRNTIDPVHGEFVIRTEWAGGPQLSSCHRLPAPCPRFFAAEQS